MKAWRGFALGAVQSVLLGAAVGCAAAGLEVLMLLPAAGRPALALLAPAAAFYAGVWAVASLAWGAVAAGLSRAAGRALRPGLSLARWQLAVLLPACVFVIVGGHVNIRFLPSYTDPRSVAFNLAFFLANVALAVWLARSGVPWAWAALAGVPRGVWAVLLALAVGGGIVAVGQRAAVRQREVPLREAAPGAPNVLLITVDALRYDHLSRAGYPRATTPNLDRLAGEGAWFSRAFANASWTRASVATLFTSLYPSTHGVNGIATGLSPALVTLPEHLHDHGYATGIFSANAFVSPLFGYAQAVERFHHRRVSMFNELILGHIFRTLRKLHPVLARVYRVLEEAELPFASTKRATTAPGLNAAFLKWIQTLAKRPFFAYFHYMETHTPYDTPAPFNRQFEPDERAPLETDLPLFDGFRPFSKANPVAPEQLERIVAQYDGAIAYVDSELGKMFQALRERGLYDNTVVMVTADHGEEFYDHEGWGHGKSLFNEAIHVPLILRAPRLLGPKVIDTVVRHVDVMPTLLDLAGVKVPDGLEGRSLAALLASRGEGADSPPVYSEVFHEHSFARSVIEEGFKLIEVHVHDREARLLFNLYEDPNERRPLEVGKHPMAPKLQALMGSIAGRAAHRAVEPGHADVDLETREHLRTLGYLQ